MSASNHKTVRRLMYFCAIAEAGSIRGAARELGLSVPVLSAALAELEQELGISLANRSTRSFKLTNVGKTVVDHAKRIATHVEHVADLAKSERVLTGHLGISLPIELTATWLPERLSAFQKRHPLVTVAIDARDEVLELRDSSIDIAIRAGFQEPDGMATEDHNLRIICAGAEEPEYLAEGDSLTLNCNLLVNPGGRDWIAANPGANQPRKILRGNSVVHVSNRLSSLALASHGIGVALTTESAARDYFDAGLLTQLFPMWDFGHLKLRIVYRDEYPSAEARAFAALLDDV